MKKYDIEPYNDNDKQSRYEFEKEEAYLRAKKKLEKAKDPNHKPSKIHTKTNKTLVKIKQSRFGYWILILLTPSFISIPLGSILIAKFYRHKRGTWVRMLFAVLLFAFIYSYFSDIIIAWLK